MNEEKYEQVLFSNWHLQVIAIFPHKILYRISVDYPYLWQSSKSLLPTPKQG